MTGDARTTRLSALPVQSLRGVGPHIAARLARLGVSTVQDLLFHLPTRYEDRTRVTPIADLREGSRAVVIGDVLTSRINFGRRRSLLVNITDGTGAALCLRFFNFSANQQQSFGNGARIRCFGTVRVSAQSFEMVHPEYAVLASKDTITMEEHLTPIYPVTEGLRQQTLLRLTREALSTLNKCGVEAEILPATTLGGRAFPNLDEALRTVHQPASDVSVELLNTGMHPAQQRLAFEELLAHHLSLRLRRCQLDRQRAPALVPMAARGGGEGGLRLCKHLSFDLTPAQRRVSGEILSDVAGTHPMQRLLQGDVGSGKTVVAAIAALHAVDAGFQVAFMAPTELLADQHRRCLERWFEPFDIKPLWLAGGMPATTRAAALDAIAGGDAKLVVGTHALFQEQVSYARLGLVVIDEQHRFGVRQRLALKAKSLGAGETAHQLIMTATPIPRTLAMTAYADLDASVIDELPAGRKPVETAVIPDTRRQEVIRRISRACKSGTQAYWVCPLIEESETLECETAEETAARLESALPELRVGLVHGRLRGEDKERTMHAFAAGDIDLLVATTVIEVGVDVPDAALMIIENAERFGLAQLHQLRGRVGRGSRPSACLLMYHGPLSDRARARLEVLRETNDGFEIARRDLELRGPGEVLGTRQTGALDFRIADLRRDRDLLSAVNETANALLEQSHAAAERLVGRWLHDRVHYSDA